MLLLSQHLNDYIHRHSLVERPLVIALSGGVDSVALLLAAVEVKKQLTSLNVSAVHVNHGLSNNAQKWSEHCEELCQLHHMPFTTKVVSIDKQAGQSLEHLARRARYKAIEECAMPSAVILTGHHRTDQAETFLLRLMRSAGLTGLGAMRSLSDYPEDDGRQKSLQLGRPFLDLHKTQLVTYVEAYNTTWVEDESNSSLSFDRNFLRQQVFPELQKRWANYDKSICHSVQLLQDEAALLTEYVRDDYHKCLRVGFAEQPTLDLIQLAELGRTKQRAVIRMFCVNQVQTYPSQNVLLEVMTSLLTAKHDQQPSIRFGEYSFRRHREQLYLARRLSKRNMSREIEVDQQITLDNDCYSTLLLLCEDKVKFDIQFNQGSDKLKMAGNVGSKSVKQAYKDMGCPPWLRDQVPLIYYEGNLIAIGSRYFHPHWQNRLTVNLTADAKII